MNPFLDDPMGRYAPRAVRHGHLAGTIPTADGRGAVEELIRHGIVQAARFLRSLRDAGFRFAGAHRPSGSGRCCEPACCAAT